MTTTKLKALSIQQPWATAILTKGKNIENRSWNTKYRGYFAIHASKGFREEMFEAANDDYNLKLEREDLAFGAILGFANLVEVVTEESLKRKHKKWFQGDYGFVLEGLILLKNPVPARGALSFWSVEAAIKKKCFQQISIANKKRVLANLLKPIV